MTLQQTNTSLNLKPIMAAAMLIAVPLFSFLLSVTRIGPLIEQLTIVASKQRTTLIFTIFFILVIDQVMEE